MGESKKLNCLSLSTTERPAQITTRPIQVSSPPQPLPPSTPPHFSGVFAGKKVWLSGVSGFKGAWLAEWLLSLGAEIRGFSLPPPTAPSLFEQTCLASRIVWDCADLRDADAVSNSLVEASPDFVFHLAAQPLVRLSYREPVETWAANVMGTIHVLEALRRLNKPCAAVMITTDKCYENREWLHGYREDDGLGGYDPYSSSKAGCELAIASWRRSFFKDHPVNVASARAGNVIGGGDWAQDRIVPDCIRALEKGESIPVRNKIATRPWQHVLEPLGGYLLLASKLASLSQMQSASASAAAFNFGPALDSNRTVADIVQEILKHWPGEWQDKSDPNAPHEAGKLNLATDKSFHVLGWEPRWDFATTIEKTIAWYRSAANCRSPEEFSALTRRQIVEYQNCG
jgi:CDP-glucose 4,6-dehydratase